jgi:hypothetical protein
MAFASIKTTTSNMLQLPTTFGNLKKNSKAHATSFSHSMGQGFFKMCFFHS